MCNEFTYGNDGNRYRCDFYTFVGTTKTWQSSKVYIGNSEFGYFLDPSKNYARTIIKAPTGVCAVYQDSGGVKAFYYIHTDYQGSWLAITNSSATVVKNYSYDAWGRPRSPINWTLMPVSTTNALTNTTSLNNMQPRFDRGYTGHEMVCGFGLINMNGRLYDPYLQRFLSPDKYVQAPGNAQNYNRYSYCLNNPLMYTDPSGYNFWSWTKKNALFVGTEVLGVIVVVVACCLPAPFCGIGIVIGAGIISTGFNNYGKTSKSTNNTSNIPSNESDGGGTNSNSNTNSGSSNSTSTSGSSNTNSTSTSTNSNNDQTQTDYGTNYSNLNNTYWEKNQKPIPTGQLLLLNKDGSEIAANKLFPDAKNLYFDWSNMTNVQQMAIMSDGIPFGEFNNTAMLLSNQNLGRTIFNYPTFNPIRNPLDLYFSDTLTDGSIIYGCINVEGLYSNWSDLIQ